MYPVTHTELKHNAEKPHDILEFEELRFGRYCDVIEIETIIKAIEAEKTANDKYGRRDKTLNRLLSRNKAMIKYFKSKSS